ncbi:MAG: hypothetical protein GF313_05190 [Caldithrix sp.]|nr:hypothetical protein [Caldithrix sp.]
MKVIVFILTLGFSLVWFSACEQETILSPEKQVSRLSLDLQGLNALGDSAWYELWLEYKDGEDVVQQSIFTFQVEQNGEISRMKAEVPLGFLQKANRLFISIEADSLAGVRLQETEEDGDVVVDTVEAAPSRFEILSSPIYANFAELGPAVNFDFRDALGTYLLATPTDTNVASPTSGLWFVDVDTSNQKIAGLNLPTVDGGWMYESWVKVGSDTLSLGKFTNPAASDMSAVYSGTAAGFPFPGEDFLQNAPDGISFPLDLSGLEVFVTLQPPYPVYSNNPATFIPLKTAIPSNPQAEQVYQLDNNFENMPGAYIEFDIEIYE